MAYKPHIGPNIPDIHTLIQAGFNPKTGLPAKFTDDEDLKCNIKRFLRNIDEQTAVNRFTWYNLPGSITGQELERMLYYKGQLCFFYSEELDEFYFMPYALDGTIDFYGRFNTIHPVPMTCGTTETEKKLYKAQEDYLSQLKLKCVYGISIEDADYDTMTKSCVLLHDYTKQLSQTIIPRQLVNDSLLDIMAECIPYMRTSLISGTGIKGLRVNDADQEDAVKEASRSLRGAALRGQPWIPIVGNVEFQDLTDGQLMKASEYMLAMQSVDNLRLSGYGLENGGLFEKKQHMLESENDVNQANVGIIAQDGLTIRQNFCNIVNSIWGLGIWCEPSESAIQADLDGDGAAFDDNEDGSNSSVDSGGNNNGNDATV